MIATSPLMFGKRRISNKWAGERDASPEAQQSHHGLRTAIATNSTTWKKPDNVAPLPRANPELTGVFTLDEFLQ